MNEKNIFAIKPIKLFNFGNLGHLSPGWIATDYFLSKSITQNILYSAYHEAKSISEIADLLGVKNSIIEEEVYYLEKNGFIDIFCPPNHKSHISNTKSELKYLTHFLIHDFTAEVFEERNKIFTQFANTICETYIPQLLNTLSPFPHPLSNKLYTPNNDQNFLLWSLISFACQNKFNIPTINQNLEKHFVKRNDGSENLPFATLKKNFELSYDEDKYFSSRCGMILNERQYGQDYLRVWQYNTYYDNRNTDWLQAFYYKYVYLYRTKICPEHSFDDKNDRLEKIIRHNFFVAQEMHPLNPLEKENDFVNMVVTTLTFEELLSLFPPISQEMIELNSQLGEKIYQISKSQYPPHLKELCHAFCHKAISSDDMIVRILENLVSKGVLKPLNEVQKPTVNMIMFCDRLPES